MTLKSHAFFMFKFFYIDIFKTTVLFYELVFNGTKDMTDFNCFIIQLCNAPRVLF